MLKCRNLLCWLLLAGGAVASVSNAAEAKWRLGAPVLSPGAAGTFDEVAVKDPSVVFSEGRWHVFYTARGRGEYATGYVWAESLEQLPSARRHEIENMRGRDSRYACAPQVFFFRPQGLWYLICQTRDANYQPVYATTKTIEKPDSWSAPKPLLPKDDKAKWIDFWVICDATTAYLFYTRGHRDVYVRTTPIEKFPDGWSAGVKAFGPVHEAAHIYKAKDRDEYHMIYELNEGGVRSFGLATARQLGGPWSKVTDTWAVGSQLTAASGEDRWTDIVSHGEAIRTGCDERLEYDADHPRLLIQGRAGTTADGPYQDLSWKLGIISRMEMPSL
ncbi:MAG: hypothetical protein JW741_12640 [Sedimentisphaerales bacterium]|nr:hypothetical protein [Sedimentisphaerales bacterium]